MKQQARSTLARSTPPLLAVACRSANVTGKPSKETRPGRRRKSRHLHSWTAEHAQNKLHVVFSRS